MAEAAFLRRSFSNPSETSHEFSERDPTRALGESISFGRYMSENLDWDKWSTFSHNRYLEEAERSSKPGSVAKMKAYFEAHYRKIGAMKEAALDQANVDSSNVEPDNRHVEQVSSLNSPALKPETTLPDSHSTVNELPMNDVPNVEHLQNVIVSSCSSSTSTKVSQSEEVNIVESNSSRELKQYLPEVQEYKFEDAVVNASVTESSVEIKLNQCNDAFESDNIMTTAEGQVTIEKEAEEDNFETKSKKKPADSLSKSSKKSKVSKLSASIARLATPVRPKKEGSGTPINHKSAKESLENKIPTSKSVQISLNFNSDVKLTKKSSPLSHKTRIEVFTPLGKIISNRFVHSPAPSTCRASVHSVSRHPYGTPQLETRRSRVELKKSLARNRTLDHKLQSPSVRNMMSPAQSPISFSPFNFRTEERAAKRKEFFERRLEKEAEKLQLFNNDKVKSKADLRKLSHSVYFTKATVDTRREVLSDKKHKTKIPLEQPQAAKSENKRFSNLPRGKCSQPQSSVGSKPASANNKPVTVTLSTKKRHENASPNIL